MAAHREEQASQNICAKLFEKDLKRALNLCKKVVATGFEVNQAVATKWLQKS